MESEQDPVYSAKQKDVDKKAASNIIATSTKKLDNLALNTNKAGMQGEY